MLLNISGNAKSFHVAMIKLVKEICTNYCRSLSMLNIKLGSPLQLIVGELDSYQESP